jgi:signal peptide peptidase SppA
MPKPVNHQHTSDTTTDTILWCGSEASYEAYVRGRDAIMAGIVAGTLKAFDGGDEDTQASSHLLTREGNIGIITVAGSLTNENSPFNKYFGLVSYGEIGNALQAAVADQNIKHIVMNYATGGGAVSGVHDLAVQIKAVNDTMKPVSTYTGSTMASAGLWLGASSRSIEVGPTAVIGSIGILNVHTETSKMMSDMGVKRTVIRSGQYKALMNPHEPLTDAAKAQAEKMMGEIYTIFMGHVASARKQDYAKADAAYGQGREFVGQQAVDVGLASSVTSFDAFIAKLQQQVDKTNSDPHNAGNYQRGKSMTLKALSQATADAMKAAGCSDEQIAKADQNAFEANEAAAKVKADADAAAALKAQQDAAAALLAASTGNSLSAETLLTKLTAQTGELLKAQAEAVEAKAKVAPLEASLEGCRGIIAASLNAMKIGLGGSAADHKATSIVDLLKAHAETETAFKAKYPNGQVSATSAAHTAANPGEDAAWLRQAERAVASKKA